MLNLAQLVEENARKYPERRKGRRDMAGAAS